MSGTDTFTPNALRPLRHYADFRGRSTRTELIAFYILFIFAGMAVMLAFGLNVIDDALPRWLRPLDILWLATLCPWLALGVRRLHDSGRSGWWLLIALPAAGVNAYEDYHWAQHRFVQAPGLIEIPAGLCLLALMVLLLWKDQEGANGYGPNPRFDDSGRTGDRPEGAL